MPIHIDLIVSRLMTLLSLVIFSLTLNLSMAVAAVSNKESNQHSYQHRVKDLSYGVALYEYFQQNYFYAMREIMVAQEQQSLINHQAEAKLLLGGMQLSYGMDVLARQSFEAVLDTAANDNNAINLGRENHARAWFYLGKLAAQKNKTPSAMDALSRINDQLSPELHDELAFMYEKLILQNTQTPFAPLSFVPKLTDNSVYHYYRVYNYAISKMRSDETQWEETAALLKTVYQDLNQSKDLDNRDELLELRDKVFTTLGALYLSQGLNEQAIKYFTQVQQEGAQTGIALVGYGWASINHVKAKQMDYQAALTPWLTLQSRSMAESSTYEALLAVPYIYNISGYQQQAINAYDYALAKMTEALKTLAVIRGNLKNEKEANLLNQSQALSGAHWLNSEVELFEPTAFNDKLLQEHLSELLATRKMRSLYGQLNDIYWLASNLQSWRERIETFDFAVKERQSRSKDLLSNVVENEFIITLNQLLTRQKALSAFIEKAQQPENVQLLFTTQEKKTAARIENALLLLSGIEEKTSVQKISHPSVVNFKHDKNKLEKMQMMLYWQASNEQADRLWKKQKIQQSIESQLNIAYQRVSSLPLLTVEITGQAAFIDRLVYERDDIDRLSENLNVLRERVEAKIIVKIIEEIEKRERRLQQYIGQVRLSKAVLLEQQLDKTPQSLGLQQ